MTSLAIKLGYILFLTFFTTCDGFYRKPYDVGSVSKEKLVPPKPKTTQRPYIPVIWEPATTKGIEIIYETPSPDIRQGGRSGRYSTGWGVTFNIWIWVEVVPITETYVKWYFRTTTIPSVVVVEWYTTQWTGSWGHQIRAYDDRADQIEKQRTGQSYNCFSWQEVCVENYNYQSVVYTGKMRSIGGGTDGTDNTLIAFIVIAVLIGGGIGGVMYYQKKTAASLAEGEQVEGEGDAEAKEEPAEGADDEKEEEEG